MSTPFAITATIDGKPLNAIKLAVGAVVVARINTSEPVDLLHVQDVSRKPLVWLGSTKAAPYKIQFTVPAGVTRLQVEARRGGVTVGTQQFPVTLADGGGNLPAGIHTIEWGATTNDDDGRAVALAAIKRIAADGAKWVRLWSGIGAISSGTAELIRAAVAAGLKVVLCVQPKDGDSYTLGTPDWMAYVVRNAAMLKLCTYVEAGNELNLVQYRPDDLGGGSSWYAPYVDRWLRPLFKALQTIGVKVLCTSVTDSEHPDNYAMHAQGLAAAGAAACCHGLALHVYCYADGKPNVFGISQLAAVLSTYSQILGGLPVLITECNLHKTAGSGAAYLGLLMAYHSAIRASAVVLAILHYRLVPSNNPGNNKSGRPLVDAAGQPAAVYAVLLKAMAS